MYDLFTVYGPLFVCVVLLAIGLHEQRANHRWRQNRDRTHAAWVADIGRRADRLAAEGHPRPGTAAVYETDPDFDFTLGGRVIDDRRLENHPPTASAAPPADATDQD